MYHNPKCYCQKQITFTLKQFQLEGSGFNKPMKKRFKGSQSAWNKFLKTVLNITSPFIGMAVRAKTKNPLVGQATANFLKSVSGGKFLSLTDMHGQGLKLKDM